ncbi:MAG: hypothetical protein M5U34_33555 [Chloroflexi bacterium]|nr:hypothetical protein [Chloroflexota bacterium]
MAGVYHDPQQHKLFQVGKNKQGSYETQFKLMLASLDPLGLLLALDVVPGNRADDPLYVPCYQRVKDMLKKNGLLIVGDSKMSAINTRTAIVAGNDYYLTPYHMRKSEPDLLDALLVKFKASQEKLTAVFLPEDVPDDGSDPDLKLAIAEGFEVSRMHSEMLGQEKVSWEERCLVVRSFSYQQTMQAALKQRLAKAEKALRQLTPARGRGKHQIDNEEKLKEAIARLEKEYKVAGLLTVSYTQDINERTVRAYGDRPHAWSVKSAFRCRLHVIRKRSNGRCSKRVGVFI